MKRCSALVIDSHGAGSPHVAALARVGFLVRVTAEWPSDALVRQFEVLVVCLASPDAGSMLAARLRAKPHFGGRLLVAVIEAPLSNADRRAVLASGFDEAVHQSCASAVLIARILRRLRGRPEYRCTLRRRDRRAA